MRQPDRVADEILREAQKAGWTGSDPYDALWFPWPGWLVGGRRRRQVVIQSHARLPVDVRRLYRRRHPRNVKALALFAVTAIRLERLWGSPEHGRIARELLDLLDADRSSGTPGWGYPFDVQTRWSFYPKDTPNIIATTFAGLALLEGGRALDEPRYLARAEEAARWVRDVLRDPAGGHFVYHPGSTTLIHNANVLGARFVWDALTPDASGPVLAAAIEQTLSRQAADGSFPYGEGEGLTFVDSFHTGFVLEHLSALSGDRPELEDPVRRGAEYYTERFFGPDGSARLWPERPFPLDAHSAGTGLTTLSALAARGVVDEALVRRVADWTTGTLVRDGHATFRIYKRGRTRVRYIRWADGHVAMGLANAAKVLTPA